MLDELFQLSRQFLVIKNQEYRRYFINKTDLSHRMNIVMGARGIGKTTTLIQSLLDYAEVNTDSSGGSSSRNLGKSPIENSKILYLQADHFLMKDKKLYEIAEYFSQHGGEYLAIDEIHKYPDWSMELKSIFDTFLDLKILASGSSALEIARGSHDLSRRALVYRMYGLSFREYLEIEYGFDFNNKSELKLKDLVENHEVLAREILTQLESQQVKVLVAFKSYLKEGYYPYRKSLNSEEHYRMALEQNIHVTLDSDLAAIHPELTGRSIAKIKKLLSFIANQVPFSPNWTKVASILELGDLRTVKQYFHYLEAAELILGLGSQSRKLKGLETPEKIFLNNSNLIYALASDSPEIGTVRETFFSNILMAEHEVTLPKSGDFQVDQEFTFEVGGAKKSFDQIAGIPNSFLVVDDIEVGFKQRIPLWLFGFLY